MRKKILVAISGCYPFGTAYSARTRALVQLLNRCQFEVDVLCDNQNGDASKNEHGNIIAVCDNKIGRIKTFALLPFLYRKKLESLVCDNEYDAIVSRSMFDRFGFVLSVAKRHNLPIILESCEWYDVKGFRRGNLDVRWFQFNICMKYLYNHVNAVIAISRLLEEHYRYILENVIRIPAILDVNNYPCRLEPNNNNKIRIMFSGSVFGGKEMFSELLESIQNVNKTRKNVELHVYGPTEVEFLGALNNESKKIYNNIKDVVLLHGKVDQDKMYSEYLNSDFGVFFRPDRRSSHAGFPTKLGEFLAAGTPVITNNTGDISMIIRNDNNGFILENTSAETITCVLNKCCNMSRNEIANMRKAARKSAVELLDISAYTDEMDKFINSVINTTRLR